MKMKEDTEKAGLTLTISKTKIMVSGPITLWKMDGEMMETVTEFIYLFIYLLLGRGGSKITADGDCCYENKDVGSLKEKI